MYDGLIFLSPFHSRQALPDVSRVPSVRFLDVAVCNCRIQDLGGACCPNDAGDILDCCYDN